MLAIEKFDKLIKLKELIKLDDANINRTLFWAYRVAKEESHNKLIDFDEVIWDEDIEPIARTLAEECIKEFTISSNFSGLIPTLAKFEEYGIYMDSLTTVNSRYTDWKTGELEKRPAIKMVLR